MNAIRLFSVGCYLLTTSVALSQVANEDLKLLPADGAEGDFFGRSVAISESVVAVGAYRSNADGTWSGSAYLFDSLTGEQTSKLTPNDGALNLEFGLSIAVSGNIVAVGAHGDDNGTLAGSAYLFDANSGLQTFKLTPNDGNPGDHFGHSIAMSDSYVVVGASFSDDNGLQSGSAYIFEASSGKQLFKLLPTDGAAGDRFGKSVSVDGSTVAIGAFLDDDLGDKSGSAYLFDANTGSQITKLLPDDGSDELLFGTSISINDGIVAVGAPFDDQNGIHSGAAYLFDITTGMQIAKLLPTDGMTSDFFGESVSINNGIVVVGAAGNDDNGARSGSAYLFNTSSYSQISKLLPTDGKELNEFGISVAIDSGVIVAGAHLDGTNGEFSGSAYVIDVNCPPADLNNDYTLDFFDVSAFMMLFAAQDPIADFTNDGNFDFFDISAFLAAFAAGCP